MKTFVLVTVLLFVLVASVLSADLITKDDFSCVVPELLAYPKINVDVKFYSDNSFYQIIRLGTADEYLTQFYANGDIKNLTGHNYPFGGDSSIATNINSYATIDVNEFDYSVVPVLSNISGTTENYVYYMNQQGEAVSDLICFTCDDTMFSSTHNKWYNQTDIGYSGIIGNVDIYLDTTVDYFDRTSTIVVRFYSTVTGELSEPIIVTDMANPMPNLLAPSDTLFKTDEPVVLKIFQDNSFVVAWKNSVYFQERVFYRVYNNDRTPRTGILSVDCEGNVNDCIGYAKVQYFSITNEKDGDFYISWVGVDSSDYTHNVWVRGFNADGSPKYDMIRVNEHDSLYIHGYYSEGYIKPKVVCNNSGNLLVTWGQGTKYKPVNMYTQKIDSQGNLVGHNYRINNINATIISNRAYACDLSDDGQAIFMWPQLTDNGEYQVFTQLMPYDQVSVFVPGDVNFDMQSDISDLIAFVSYMFQDGDYSFYPEEIIDFNTDGANGDISDLVYLVQYMFDNGPAPAVLSSGIRPNPAN